MLPCTSTWAALAVLPGLSSAVSLDADSGQLGQWSLSNEQVITVDASSGSGQLKNLQGTNNADTSLKPLALDKIHDMVPAIADLWPQYGLGKSVVAGDASLNGNYNWTVANEYVRFVTSRGVKVSIQFGSTNSMNDTVSSPAMLGQIGCMITDRYMNGAHQSGFKDALELLDFCAESDLIAASSIDEAYEQAFRYSAGFANGVAKLVQGCLYDLFVSQFYADCKKHNVLIKAATYHFTNAQYSLDPYDIKVITDNLHNQILVPAGLPDLPIWVTEFELNPSGIQPTSAAAKHPIATLPSSRASLVAPQCFGYGDTGAGNAPYQPWFTNMTVPFNDAAAWLLQASLILETVNRVSVHGASSDGFAALAGRSSSLDKVQDQLNNYQPNYDIACEIAAQSVPWLTTSTTADPLVQPNGLLNGLQGCLYPGTQFVIPVCQTYVQATIRNNTSSAYWVPISSWRWSETARYRVVIQRVGGGSVHQLLQTWERLGNKAVVVVASFPANAQDLIAVTKL